MKLNDVIERLSKLNEELGDYEIIEVDVMKDERIVIDLYSSDFIDVVNKNSGVCGGSTEGSRLTLRTRWYASGIGEIIIRTHLYA